MISIWTVVGGALLLVAVCFILTLVWAIGFGVMMGGPEWAARLIVAASWLAAAAFFIGGGVWAVGHGMGKW